MVNKPERVLTSSADEPGAGRRTVVDLVQHPSAGRLFPVGRLEFATAGLVLLTNDGALANRLTHPRYGVPKVYRALAKGTLDVVAVERARAGLAKELRKSDRREGRVIPAASGEAPRVELEITGYEEGRTELRITLRDGRLGNVGAMLSGAGVHVRKLERTGIGPLTLRGVARGGWRELERGEVGALRRAAGMRRKKGAKRPAGVTDEDPEVEL
jgi:pseudouridine synthase